MRHQKATLPVRLRHILGKKIDGITPRHHSITCGLACIHGIVNDAVFWTIAWVVVWTAREACKTTMSIRKATERIQDASSPVIELCATQFIIRRSTDSCPAILLKINCQEIKKHELCSLLCQRQNKSCTAMRAYELVWLFASSIVLVLWPWGCCPRPSMVHR